MWIIHAQFNQAPAQCKIWRADITYFELRPGTWVYPGSIYWTKGSSSPCFKIGRQMEAMLVVEND